MWHVLSKPMALQTGHILTVELIYLFCYTNSYVFDKKKNKIKKWNLMSSTVRLVRAEGFYAEGLC